MPPGCLPVDPGGTFDSVCGPRPSVSDLLDESSAETRGPGSWRDPHLGLGEPTRPAIPVPPEEPRYVVVKRVGRGGFGEVWEAVQTALNRTVAIKHLHLKAEDEAEARELEKLFRHEAFTTAALDHPNIVPVYDFGTDEHGRPMLAMKLVRGENWDAAIRRDLGVLSPIELLARHLPILADVAQAVVFAHDAGVVHRDIKPAQVMLGPYGEVLLMDWGLAVLVDAPPGHTPLSAFDRERIAPRATNASAPAGTPAYMAPEQTEEDGSRVGPWTDVYLLGGTLYLLLTGARPHESATSAHAFELARSGVIVPPAERAPDRTLPADLVELAMRALEPDPVRRTLGAREFHEVLLGHMSGASRRRESTTLAAEAIRRADPLPASYAELTELVNMFDRAMLLWPDNPVAAKYREECLAAQARMATTQGDLLLARTSIGRVQSAGLREELSRSLRAAEVARGLRERERKVLRLATGGLVLVVLFGGAALLSNLAGERTAAQQARSRAEGLLGYMLGDLRRKLEPVGRVEVLDSVVQRAGEYLDSVPPDERDLTARLQRISTTVQLAVIDSARGNQDRGATLLAQQVPVVEALLGEHPGDTRVLAVAAELRASLGRIHTERGLLGPAGEEKIKARDLYRHLLEAEPWEREWLRECIQVTRDLGDDAFIQGRPEDGERFYRDAIALIAKRRQSEPDEREWRYAEAAVQMHYALGIGSFGDAEGLAGRGQAAIELLNPLIEKNPRDFSALNLRAMSHFCRGNGLGRLDRVEEGIRALETGERESRLASESDPANLDWYTDYLQIKAELGRLLLDVGRGEEAFPKLEEVRVALEREVAARPDNALWRRDLAFLAKHLGKYYRDKGDKLAAATILARGAEVLMPVWERDQSVVTYLNTLQDIRTELRDMVRDLVFQGKSARVVDQLRISRDLTGLLLKHDAGNAELRDHYVDACSLYAVPVAQAGRYAEAALAISQLEELLVSTEKFKAGDPVALADRDLLVNLLRGCNEETAGHFPQAAEFYEKSADGYRRYGEALPAQRGIQHALSALYLARASIMQLRAGNIDRAETLLGRSQDTLDEAGKTIENEPSGAVFLLRARMGHMGARVRLLREKGEAASAAKILDAVLAALEPYRESQDAKLVEAYANALKLAGRGEEAQAIIDRLDSEGFLSEMGRRSFDRIGQ